MFHPYPFADPKAVNPVIPPVSVRSHLITGPQKIAQSLAREVGKGKRKIGLDAYPGVDTVSFSRILQQSIPDLIVVDARSLALEEEELNQKLLPFLPQDRELDPVLLYGRRFEEGYPGLQSPEKIRNLQNLLQSTDHPVAVCGMGALCPALRDLYDLKIWMDITPRQSTLNFKNGLCGNYGASHALPYSQLMRRNYYVDFETAMNARWDLIRQNALDLYISSEHIESMQMLPYEDLLLLFRTINQSPFRCRPVYLEGVWGGYYMHHLRHLPSGMRNCAWIFDLIPMEVSLAAVLDQTEFEVPFYTFVQVMGEELLGRRAMKAFGGYFPIRFNYDDTWHSNGNMSVQCHPDEAYVVKHHSELGRQDESYYVCVTGQGARTFLGFREEGSCDAFFEEAEHAQETHELIDYEKYIHAVPSIPGTQLMIPAGTVHASGKNQLILEIGSLTVGSYTYKLYDYQRIDPQTGLPRPIHLRMGRAVIHPERTAEYVQSQLVNHGRILRKGEGFCEKVVGEHELLYFSLRNLIFDHEIRDDTQGDFHVLALVDGERVRIESLTDPNRHFDLDMLEIAVVPATFGPYRITNLSVGTVVVHKTLLKQES